MKIKDFKGIWEGEDCQTGDYVLALNFDLRIYSWFSHNEGKYIDAGDFSISKNENEFYLYLESNAGAYQNEEFRLKINPDGEFLEVHTFSEENYDDDDDETIYFCLDKIKNYEQDNEVNIEEIRKYVERMRSHLNKVDCDSLAENSLNNFEYATDALSDLENLLGVK